ncbi:hypothetical protein [Altererythrobacter fulvus]|uniref:hypothetical protein n=1 Tax=Caenibius fulvus TaxID=2126012 RepID=UPI00301AB343
MAIEWTPAGYVGVAFALYAAVHIGLALGMGRIRRDLVRHGEELLADPSVSREEKARVNRLLDNCFSFKVCILIPIAVISILLDEILGNNQKQSENFEKTDPRMHSLYWRYFSSVLAANPVFGLFAVLFVVFGALIIFTLSKANGSKKDRVANAFEQPMWKATAAVQ